MNEKRRGLKISNSINFLFSYVKTLKSNNVPFNIRVTENFVIIPINVEIL